MNQKCFVLAFDSFKESMNAQEACEAAAVGIRKVIPDASIKMLPMGDGGEGTMRSMVDTLHGFYKTAIVCDALRRERLATYGVINDTTVIIEMAEASGLEHIVPHLRDPWKATTYGTGQLIKHALDE